MSPEQSATKQPDNLLEKGHEGVFFRVLGLDLGKGEKGTLARWNAENYSTIHLATLPTEWLDIYFSSGSQNREDYDLGDLHEDALSNFFDEAEKYDSREAWERIRPLPALPLNAVCGFSDEIEALRYAMRCQGGGLQVATFRGKVIRSLRAETAGYLVEVVEKLELEDVRAFAAKVGKSQATNQSALENETK